MGASQGVVVNTSVPVASETRGDILVHSTSVLEEATSVNEGVLARKLGRTTEGVDGVGKSVNGVSVVEGLGAEDVEECATAKKR